jgi:hypothetical protein
MDDQKQLETLRAKLHAQGFVLDLLFQALIESDLAGAQRLLRRLAPEQQEGLPIDVRGALASLHAQWAAEVQRRGH